jgi:hypothetical protein
MKLLSPVLEIDDANVLYVPSIGDIVDIRDSVGVCTDVFVSTTSGAQAATFVYPKNPLKAQIADLIPFEMCHRMKRTTLEQLESHIEADRRKTIEAFDGVLQELGTRLDLDQAPQPVALAQSPEFEVFDVNDVVQAYDTYYLVRDVLISSVTSNRVYVAHSCRHIYERSHFKSYRADAPMFMPADAKRATVEAFKQSLESLVRAHDATMALVITQIKF